MNEGIKLNRWGKRIDFKRKKYNGQVGLIKVNSWSKIKKVRHLQRKKN